MNQPNPQNAAPENRTHWGLKLRQKRLTLSLSRSALADCLGVSSTTIANWENSPVPNCRPSLGFLPENFIQGRYDCQILEKKLKNCQTHLKDVEKMQLRRMHAKILSLHTLCMARPELQTKLLRKIQCILSDFPVCCDHQP